MGKASTDAPHTVYGLVCPECRSIRYVGITKHSIRHRVREHRAEGTRIVKQWLHLEPSPLLIRIADTESRQSAAQCERMWTRTCGVAFGKPMLNHMYNGGFISRHKICEAAKTLALLERYGFTNRSVMAVAGETKEEWLVRLLSGNN